MARLVPLLLPSSLLLALGACGGSPTAPPTPPPTPPPPPANIVVVMADDLEAQAIGNMTRLDTLITRQGTRFANAFVTTPLCAPSRASFLTGQYAHNHGVMSNGPPNGGFQVWHSLNRDPNTVGAWLRTAGYRTALVGKYLNNYPASAPSSLFIPPGWDEWMGLMLDRRAELGFYSLNDNGRLVELRGREPETYQTDVLGARAVDFIRRSESNDAQPFFLYVGVSAPHRPAVPAARHDNELGGVRPSRNESFNEDDVRDKPGWVQRTRQLTQDEIDFIDEEYRDRQLTMLAVDELIERLVRTLDETGELANTYIVFTSDNGIFQGEHRQTGKSAAYDEAIRVPLIVRGPDVPAGRTLDHLVGNIDLAPTFVTLARATVPDTVDGRSLVPLLGATPPATSAWRRELLIEHLGATGGVEESLPGPVVRAQDQFHARSMVRGMPDYSALRTETHTYVEYVTDEVELYEFRSDPYQVTNLATTGGADPNVLAQLRTRLAALRNCRGAACRQ